MSPYRRSESDNEQDGRCEEHGGPLIESQWGKRKRRAKVSFSYLLVSSKPTIPVGTVRTLAILRAEGKIIHGG